jgi:hypothetical protein
LYPFQFITLERSELLRAGLAGMQEAAQQPILIKRMLSIADWSTLALEELMPKVIGAL